MISDDMLNAVLKIVSIIIFHLSDKLPKNIPNTNLIIIYRYNNKADK